MSVRNSPICRSATLSHEVEVLLYHVPAKTRRMIRGGAGEDGDSPLEDPTLNLMESQRQQDIALLRALKITNICDLMVEDKKRKYGLSVCTSEKVDTHGKYQDATVISAIPYPGCEHFRLYHDRGYVAKGLLFDWIQDASAQLNVPSNVWAIANWSEHKQWDLVLRTQNYLRLMLHYLAEGGLLVHCISGWDRTPLMISLLRLSLWADGEVNASLAPDEILYLTLAYDWMLFGHGLADRTMRGEEILRFCFDVLSELTSPIFSFAVVCDSKQAEKRAAGDIARQVLDDVIDKVADDDPSMSFSSLSLSDEPSSRPVPVPRAVSDEHEKDWSCGSFQEIGSSPPKAGDGEKRVRVASDGDGWSYVAEVDESGPAVGRRERLLAVRKTFLRLYALRGVQLDDGDDGWTLWQWMPSLRSV